MFLSVRHMSSEAEAARDTASPVLLASGVFAVLSLVSYILSVFQYTFWISLIRMYKRINSGKSLKSPILESSRITWKQGRIQEKRELPILVNWKRKEGVKRENRQKCVLFSKLYVILFYICIDPNHGYRLIFLLP